MNVAGAEFGQSSFPGTLGTHYTFNSENTFRYFADKQLGLIRLPLQWERLQHTPGAPLDSAYLAGVKNDVAWAKANGAEVILDIHNFGRYSVGTAGSLQTYIIDNRAADGTVKVSTRGPRRSLGAALERVQVRARRLCVRPDERTARHGTGELEDDLAIGVERDPRQPG